MTPAERFIHIIEELGKKHNIVPVVNATVKSVEGATCTIVLTENDLEIPDVLLTATEDNENGLILTPKVNTNCLVGLVGNDKSNLHLVSAYDSIIYKHNNHQYLLFDSAGLKLDLNTGKLQVKNTTADLKNILTDIAQLFQTAIYTGGGGPHAADPATQTAATQIVTKINALMT